MPSANPVIFSAHPVMRQLFNRLSADDIAALEDMIDSVDHPKARQWQEAERDTMAWRTLTLQLCTHLVPESRQRTGLSANLPPPEVHMMQREERWHVGDLYSTRMAYECLAQVGLGWQSGQTYLDFGCSSGSFVRVAAAFRPEAHWYGVDPVPESVAWARDHLPSGTFLASRQDPPLDFDDNSFDGVCAISIWSHFSEGPALNWFREMARIVRPGGSLFFTTHGFQTLNWARRHGYTPEPQLAEIEANLRTRQFHFREIFGGEAHYGLETSDWGDAYFTPRWLMANVGDDWDLKLFIEGRNQENQDAYVLVKS